jgi:hypothetical protein
MSVKLTKEELIIRLQKINNTCDYSLIEYNNMHDKIIIKCKHGIFKQTPLNLLNGFFCKKCKREEKQKLLLKTLINKANNIHDFKYDYSNIKYTKMIDYVDIICKIENHGIFKQTLNNHINHKKGCPKCAINYKLNQVDFINRSNIIHDNFFDYSEVIFKNVASYVRIICPKHGQFKQTPNNHLSGIGCPYCKESKGEKIISIILKEKNIEYIRQKTFNECKYKELLKYDFYLPYYDICIEFDGRQHFESFEYFGGEKGFILTQKRDKIKNDYCKKNNIKLFRILYNENIKNSLENIINFNCNLG